MRQNTREALNREYTVIEKHVCEISMRMDALDPEVAMQVAQRLYTIYQRKHINKLRAR